MLATHVLARRALLHTILVFERDPVRALDTIERYVEAHGTRSLVVGLAVGGFIGACLGATFSPFLGVL